MNSIKMNRDELLKIVVANKQKHIDEFKESVSDYTAAALKIASSNLKLAKSGDIEQISKIRAMPMPPRSYENEYTRAIRMLELTIDDVIEVEEHIFNQLVLDEWNWKQQFTATTAMYKTL